MARPSELSPSQLVGCSTSDGQSVSISVTSQIELLGESRVLELANKVELECNEPVLIITSGLPRLSRKEGRSVSLIGLKGGIFLLVFDPIMIGLE